MVDTIKKAGCEPALVEQHLQAEYTPILPLARIGVAAPDTPPPSNPSTACEPLLDRALYLLEAGFHIFPLGGYGETPPAYFVERFKDEPDPAAAALKQWPKSPRRSWKQYQSAPPSEQTVREWWMEWPSANIGIATGKLIVVDADSDEAVAWCMKNLTHTPWRVRTGKGMHFYYAANPALEIRNSADPLAKIDTRGLGGYVVAGGSRHANGNWYQDEIDDGIGEVALCDLPMLQPADVNAIKGYRHTNMAQASAADTKQGNLSWFNPSHYNTAATGEPVETGGRNSAAASLVGTHIRAGHSTRDIKTLLDSWNQTNPIPLSDTELNTTIASVMQTHFANNPSATVATVSPPTVDIGSTRRKKQPFPKHLLEVPGLVGNVARWIGHTALSPQPIFELAAALAFCGTIMGRKVKGATGIRTNTMIVGVGASGCGKDHARGCINRLLHAAGAEHLLVAEDLASDSGLFAALFHSPANLLMIDEVGRFFGRVNDKGAGQHDAAIATMLMKLTGAAESFYREKMRAENIDKKSRIIPQPCQCLYGTTVPGRLLAGLSKNEVTDGFVPRILMFQSDDPDPVRRPAVDKTPPDELVDAVRMWAARPINPEAAGNIEALTPDPLLVCHSPEADQVFFTFEEGNRARKAATRDNGTGVDAIWARATEHALRMALIVACGRDFDQPVVQADDATWACELVEYLLHREIEEIDIHVADNEQEATVKKIIEFIREHGPISRREILRKFRSIKAFDLDAIIATLLESADISQTVVTPDGGGTPSVIYQLISKSSGTTVTPVTTG